QRISRVPLLSAAERQQQLVEWNRTTAVTGEELVPRMVEMCALRAPGETAVEYEGEYLTYGELNRRANQLAHYLREAGVGAEKLVGVYLERSVDLVVSLLAILKAGGGYLPLDPAYPRERLQFMLTDARVMS